MSSSQGIAGNALCAIADYLQRWFCGYRGMLLENFI